LQRALTKCVASMPIYSSVSQCGSVNLGEISASIAAKIHTISESTKAAISNSLTHASQATKEAVANAARHAVTSATTLSTQVARHFRELEMPCIRTSTFVTSSASSLASSASATPVPSMLSGSVTSAMSTAAALPQSPTQCMPSSSTPPSFDAPSSIASALRESELKIESTMGTHGRETGAPPQEALTSCPTASTGENVPRRTPTLSSGSAAPSRTSAWADSQILPAGASPPTTSFIAQSTPVLHLSSSTEASNSQLTPSSPEGRPALSAWKEYTASSGSKYYYNSATQVSTWERPAELQTAPMLASYPGATTEARVDAIGQLLHA